MTGATYAVAGLPAISVPEALFGSTGEKMGLPCFSREYMARAKAKNRRKSTQKTTISAMAQKGIFSVSVVIGDTSYGRWEPPRSSSSSTHTRMVYCSLHAVPPSPLATAG